MRLEFSDGKSDKFWEAEVDGHDLVLKWGRIGTAGQSKVKSFDSAEKALKELEKQSKAKLKKGYARVDEDSPSSSKTETASRETVSVPPKPAKTRKPKPELKERSSGSVHWTDKTRRKLYPRERVATKFGKPATLWKKAIKSWKPDQWLKGLGMNTPSLRRAIKSCCQAIEQGAAEECPRGVLFVMLGAPKELLEYWVAEGRVEFALETLVEACGLSEQDDGQRAYIYRVGEGHGVMSGGMVLEKHWAVLRKALLGLEEDVYRSAVERAEQLRVGASAELRCCLSFCFPRQPEWAAADAQDLVKNPPSTRWGSYLTEECWLVMHSLQEPELVKGLINSFNYFPTWVVWPILEATGENFFDILSTQLKNTDNFVADQLKPMFQALSLVETPAVGEFMAEQLKVKLPKAASSLVSEYFQLYPELALRVLPGKGREAESIASTIARSSPELAERVLGELEPSLRSSLESVLKKLTPAKPVAGLSELPQLLREPPWRGKSQAKSGRVVKTVEPASFSSRVDWRGVAKPRNYFYDRPPRDLDETRVEKDLAKLRKESSLNIFELDRVVDKAALQFLEEAPPKVWAIYQDDLLPLVARFGVEIVPGLLKLGKKRVDMVSQALSHVVAPTVAPFMAEALEKKRGAKNARLWLEHYPKAAAIGLIPLAVGKHGKSRELCERALRLLEPALVQELAQEYGEEVVEAVGDVLNADPLLSFPDSLPKLPSFADPKVLPPLNTKNGKSLPDEAVTEVLMMLCFSPLFEPYAGFEELRESLTEVSLEEFSWELFQAWLRAAAPAKEDWAFRALAHFGGDEAARRVTPLVRKWPGESAHQRAVLGLDILGQIGSDVALMNLHGIAQKLRYKALQARAKEKIEQIARRRELTTDELADRLVPDLGIGEDGALTLDFGPRQFRVTFDEQLRPQIWNEGKAVKSLPKPGKKDDAELAAQASKQFRALKKDLKQIAAGQVLRMQRAMTFRRRWMVEDFRLFLVEQPLVFQLTRRLLWACYQDGELKFAFRVAEDRTLADVEDEEIALPEGAVVGIPHPLEMSGEALASWNTVFSDYELLQPFPQLSRPVYQLEEKEASGTSLLRVQGKAVPFGSILSLEERGWRREEAYDGGVVCEYIKPYEEMRAVLRFEPGLYLGAVRESGEQTLDEVVLLRRGDYSKHLVLEELHPILMSELLLDLEAL